MSKPRSQEPSATKTSQISEPEILPIDVENVFKFAEKIKREQLTEAQKKEVSTFLSAKSSLMTLSSLINNFDQIKNNFESYSGLTEEEKIKLNDLLSKRKKFKDNIDKHEFITKEYAGFIENEKKIVPLNKKIQYWGINTDSLKKLELWESISALTKTESRKNNETPEIEKNRLYKLSDIKNEWTSHQVFCKYSSDDLYTFYKDFICELEKNIKNELTSAQKYPDIIIEYTDYLLYQIIELKKQAIYSMLYRLYCAEHFNDLTCDDLLLYTSKKIDMQCNINTRGMGLKPSARKSLSPDLLTAFIKTIETYCDENEKETSILSAMLELKMKNIPLQWKGFLTNKSKIKLLASNPVIVFFANTINVLLTQINTETGITHAILNGLKDNDLVIAVKKTRNLIEMTKAEYTKIYGKPPVKTDNDIAGLILDSETKFSATLQELKNKLEYEVKNQVNLTMDDTFNSREVNIDSMNNSLKKIQSLLEFDASYTQHGYLPGCDIILTLANKINAITSKGKYITAENKENILKLLDVFYPKLTESQHAKLKFKIETLPELIAKLQNVSMPQLIHYLCNYLEAALFSQEKLSTSLARHKHIANSYSENWDSTVANTNNDAIDSMISYINNVSLKLIQISPTITLDNFTTHDSRIVLDNLENITLAENQQKSSKNAPPYHKNLQSLKLAFEKNMFDKINNIFLLKAYLYNEKENKINLIKLQDLLTKVNHYFTDPDIKRSLLISIKNTCFSLLKTYILYTVENEKTPDTTHITNLNDIINDNLFDNLCKDNDIRIILKSYIESYDGTKNNLTSLLIGLTQGNNHTDCEQPLLKYATKRLDYIKSSLDINVDDYQFFHHYKNVTSINELFTQYKIHLNSQVKSIVNHSDISWNIKSARLIELFGDDNELTLYRMKRIKELLELNNKKLITQDVAESIFSELNSTINSNRLINKRLFNSGIYFENKINAETYLNNIITKTAWSPLLEKIVAICGTESQLQKLHFQSLQIILSNAVIPADSWIIQQLSDQPAIGKINGLEKLKQHYSNFLGDSNIKKLISLTDTALTEVARVTEESNTKIISPSDYERSIKLMTSIKPLNHIYSVYGDQPKSKNTFANLTGISNQFRLNHELNTSFKSQLDLLATSRSATALQKAISTLTQTISKLEHSGILSEKSIGSYVSYCNNNLFIKLDDYIKRTSLDFNSFAILLNFLFYLASRNTKSLLINGHKDQLSTNPYYLSLINHLDEERAINHIETIIATADNTIKNNGDFIATLTFAKRLCETKHIINERIKTTIFHDCDIKLNYTNQTTLHDLLISTTISDKQLLKLWSSYASKLTTKYLPSGVQTSYLTCFIKTVCKISDAILSRSKNNPDLLISFMDRLNTIFDIYHSIQNLPSSSSANNTALTFWADPKEPEKLLQPLFSIIQKTYLMQLLQCTEKYALRKIPKDKLPVFRTISNDNVFNMTTMGTQINSSSITTSLALKNSDDTVKVINTLKIYHHLTDILDNRQPYQSLPVMLNTLLTSAPKKHPFSLSHGYTSFLKELIALSSKCTAVINDKKISDNDLPKKSILSLLKSF